MANTPITTNSLPATRGRKAEADIIALQTGKENVGVAAALVATHEAAVDPHPQYTTVAEAAAAAPIQSVAGKTGNVTLVSTDIAAATTGVAKNIQQLFDDTLSAGWIAGFVVTDAGGGNISVSAGEALIRSAATSISPLYYAEITIPTVLAVPVNTTRHAVLDYNAGNPVVQLDLVYPVQFHTKVYLAEIHNKAGVLHIYSDPRPIGDLNNRLMEWVEGLVGTRVVSGEVTYDPTTPSRKLGVTGGVFWDRFFTKYTSTLLDTSAGGTFTAFYRNGVGDFTEVTLQTDWNNTQFDNGTGVLATLGNNKYGVHWVIREFQDGVFVQYGQAEYANQADAEAASPPTSRPEFLLEHGFYVAKIVFKKSDTFPTSILDYRPRIGGVTAIAASAFNHEDLTGLQGGATRDHKHLTATELTNVQNLQSAAYTPSTNYATALQGAKADAALPTASFTDAAVTSKLLTGLTPTVGTVAATDTILQAFNKLTGTPFTVWATIVTTLVAGNWQVTFDANGEVVMQSTTTGIPYLEPVSIYNGGAPELLFDSNGDVVTIARF